MTGYDVLGLAGLFTAAIAAGAINSVAGGGTLISFPSLVAFREPEIISNATNTAALWPGSFSSAVGYKKDTSVDKSLLGLLIIPSIMGGLLGAVVLVQACCTDPHSICDLPLRSTQAYLEKTGHEKRGR